MLNKEYPQHDMNLVFDMIENSISKGGVHDKTAEEINREYDAKRQQAVEQMTKKFNEEMQKFVEQSEEKTDSCHFRHHPSSCKTHEPS